MLREVLDRSVAADMSLEEAVIPANGALTYNRHERSRCCWYSAHSCTSVTAPAIVRLDPIWDPLRDRADFRKLIGQR
jgi:hypothetical protein